MWSTGRDYLGVLIRVRATMLYTILWLRSFNGSRDSRRDPLHQTSRKWRPGGMLRRASTEFEQSDGTAVEPTASVKAQSSS